MSDFLLFRTALRDLLRLRRLLASLVLLILPTGVALLWRARARGPADYDPLVAYNLLSASLVFGFTLVILSVIFATSAVSQDLEQRTIMYLLTRPVPRWRILLAKFAASLLVIILVVWLSTIVLALVTLGPSRMGESRLMRDLQILPLGALAYGSLSLFLGALIRWALVLGLLFAFGWESWVPSLPGDFAKLSLMAYVRVLAPHPQPLTQMTGLQELISQFNPQSISSTMAWIVLGLATFAGLAGAVVVFSERQYVPREDAE
jgi:ABC-2 type transport system permease protein